MSKSSRFIKFDKVISKQVIDTKKALRESLGADIQSLVFLGNAVVETFQADNMASMKELAENLKKTVDTIVSKLPADTNNPTIVEQPKIPVFSGSFSMDIFNNDTHNTQNDRLLDNGGMAPKKEWKSITEIELNNSLKSTLVEEMRKLKEEGKTVSKFHHKAPATIEEFTEPFKYVENMYDYNGPFLVSLLKSEIEINNAAATLQVDLSVEKQKCQSGDILVLSIYDISGSSSSGEEKKFLSILQFDKLNGTVAWDYILFPNHKQVKLSNRQISEIDKFCKSKKIIFQQL